MKTDMTKGVGFDKFYESGGGECPPIVPDGHALDSLMLIMAQPSSQARQPNRPSTLSSSLPMINRERSGLREGQGQSYSRIFSERAAYLTFL